MIEYFYEYVKKLILFLIFTSFMQVVLPSSKYKNYINLVFSMILIFIMIKPIYNIYQKISTLNIEKVIQNNDMGIKKEEYEQYEDVKNELANKFFNENIKMKTENIIPNRYNISDISLNMMKGAKGDIAISNMEIELIDTENTIYVRKYNEDKTKRYEEEIKEIKKIVSDYYSINIENIYINII